MTYVLTTVPFPAEEIERIEKERKQRQAREAEGAAEEKRQYEAQLEQLRKGGRK